MSALVFNITTALLMVLMISGGAALDGRNTIRQRHLPWVAAGLTLLAVAGVLTQLCWRGALDALDNDPAESGWWRVLTSVFMQNGGVSGAVWNIATFAVVAALAEWFWGGTLTLVLFAAGIFLPQHIDTLLGITGGSLDPRNFAGSSGATYFLGAAVAVPLLLRARERRDRLTAPAIPIFGLILWFAQDNGHGLVAAYGCALGGVLWLVLGNRLIHPERDLQRTARVTMGTLEAALGRR